MARSLKKSAAAYATLLVAAVTATRVLVLLLESIAVVRDERSSDAELLQLCNDRAAPLSLKMRSACLAAQADVASPVLFKAVLRSFHLLWKDVQSSVSSPFAFGGTLLLFLFAVASPISSLLSASSVVARLRRRARGRARTFHEDDDSDSEDEERNDARGTEIVVLNSAFGKGNAYQRPSGKRVLDLT